MAEMVDAADLKSAGPQGHPGSSPGRVKTRIATLGTK